MKCMKVHGAKDQNTVTFLEGKHVENTGGYKDMGTKRQDIRTLSKRHPKLETLMNRVDKESLIRQHRLQKKNKAPGIDMVTKEGYQENLNENINDLMHRLKSFSYNSLSGMIKEVRNLWQHSLYVTFKWLNRRSQRRSFKLERFYEIWNDRIIHPYIHVDIWSGDKVIYNKNV